MRQQRMQIQRSHRCQSATSVLSLLLFLQSPFLVGSDTGSWGSAIDDPTAEPISQPLETAYLLEPQTLAPYSDRNKCYAHVLTWILSALPQNSLAYLFRDPSIIGPCEPSLFRAASALQTKIHMLPPANQEEIRTFLLHWVLPNIDCVATKASLDLGLDPDEENDPTTLLFYAYKENPAAFHIAFDMPFVPKPDIDLFFLELLPTSSDLTFLASLEEGLPAGWIPPEQGGPFLLAFNYQAPSFRSIHLGRHVFLKPHLLKEDGTKGSQHKCELLAISLYVGNAQSGHHFALIKTPRGWLHTDTLEIEREVCIKHICPNLLLVNWQEHIP